ncbi:hypothetical protein P9B03_19825 [Metasolibacillus meyeri]|uniref:Uncharacterized protein n=1 Tax=Metasolibacillus meyeri TaxID=1071052 RepID=A0AAW9NPG5_9BACL|nr:hypothetical protein [Metasolibacillus meyeri]MEC1180709.1 hypothetical protein [Metasolibacillus meyeri]
MKEEWISSSDIGKNIDGRIFTLEDYLRVEPAYIDTVMKFLETNQIDFTKYEYYLASIT